MGADFFTGLLEVVLDGPAQEVGSTFKRDSSDNLIIIADRKWTCPWPGNH